MMGYEGERIELKIRRVLENIKEDSKKGVLTGAV